MSRSDKIDSWVESHRNLIEWLMIAEERIQHGQIVVNFHQGKITSYDVCQRERTTVKHIDNPEP